MRIGSTSAGVPPGAADVCALKGRPGDGAFPRREGDGPGHMAIAMCHSPFGRRAVLPGSVSTREKAH